MSDDHKHSGLEQFQDSESSLHATFNLAAVGIAVVAEDGRLLQVNRSFAEIVGYSRPELMGMTFQDLTLPEDLETDLENVKRLLRGEAHTYTLEKRYVRKDKSIVWSELTVSIVRPSNKPSYFISIIKDIDRRKKAEDELVKARLNLEQRVQDRTADLEREMQERELAQIERDSFFDRAFDSMMISDAQGYFRRVNPAFCELMGYTPEELYSRPLRTFVHPDDVERVAAYRQVVLSGEGDLLPPIEHRMIAKDGSVKWLSTAARFIRGRGLNYVTCRDITQIKNQEAQEKQKQIWLATNSKLNAIGLMAANMAHEINNPLAIIYGEGCLLQEIAGADQIDKGRLARTANSIVKMSERIKSIVHSLRALARDGSSDPMTLLPLKQIFDETIPFCRGKIGSKNIELKVTVPPADVLLCCRSVQLSQALLNLLNNAYDAVVHKTDGAIIQVGFELTPTRVNICVSDNGPGVPLEVRANLFQPFVTSKPAGQGMGLGLSISKSMMEANRGELYLDDGHEGWTTFVIALPRVLDEE